MILLKPFTALVTGYRLKDTDRMRLAKNLLWLATLLWLVRPFADEPEVLLRFPEPGAVQWLAVVLMAFGLFAGATGWYSGGFPRHFIGAFACFFLVAVLLPASRPFPWMVITVSAEGVLWVAVFVVWLAVTMRWIGWRARVVYDTTRLRSHLVKAAEKSLQQGLILLDRNAKVAWANVLGKTYYDRISTYHGLLQDWRPQGVRRQIQNLLLGEGEKVSLQMMPQDEGMTLVVINPMPQYSDSAQFYEHFVRRLVHDMRNPLAAIIAHASNLNAAQLPESAQYHQTATTIEYEAQRLTRIVDSMLFDARLSYVPLAITTVDMRDIVEDVLFQYDERALREDKSIQTMMPDESVLLGVDRDLVTRALGNLVDNSLKYSEAGATIVISLTADERSVWLKVSDDGDGISLELLPDRIFEPLVRGRKGQGSGLGLAIVKKIAEMHNGHVTAESMPGKGTTVSLCLPR
jgi:signal transduction histidine kinase